MGTFRVSLAAGAAVVLVLGLAKLFSLGLIAAALLVPMLTVLYLLVEGSAHAHLWLEAIVLPLGWLALMLAGPAVLLRYGPGWDYSTGLGSPDVYGLARDLTALLGK
jgi:hypothetical protein